MKSTSDTLRTDTAKKPPITVIAAVDKNGGLGYRGKLLCSLPKDLARFKELTRGHVLVMGRRTFLSLPKRPLPEREHIVLTKDPNFAHPGVHRAVSISEAVEKAAGLLPEMDDDKQEVFVIGGGAIYEAFLKADLADTLLLTHIDAEFTADTYFPPLPPGWEAVSEEVIPEEGYMTRFVTYKNTLRT